MQCILLDFRSLLKYLLTSLKSNLLIRLEVKINFVTKVSLKIAVALNNSKDLSFGPLKKKKKKSFLWSV